MNFAHLSFVLILLAVPPLALAESAADVVFVGRHIVTMDPGQYGKVQAVAVKDDRIVAVGRKKEVLRLIGPGTRRVDLGKRALLPGFIDAHGHFFYHASNLGNINLAPPPVGDIESVEDIVTSIQRWIADKQVPAGTVIIGGGYDDSLLSEGRHPNRDDLDRASSVHPIILRHVSGHLMSLNSLALRDAGISAATAAPDGGVIRHGADGEPTGVLEETAMSLVTAPDIPPGELASLVQQALTEYAAYGITTVQDGGLPLATIHAVRKQAAITPYPLDIVLYAWANDMSPDKTDDIIPSREYVGGVRLGGAKLSLDGSPQGRTAWLAEPYTEGPPGVAADYRAYPTLPPGRVPTTHIQVH